MQPEKQPIVRVARGAGRWFPGNPSQLRAMVSEYLEAATVPAVTGRIVAAFAPHAGYVYSGKVAGYTFRALRDNATETNAPDTVVVLGFSHQGGFDGLALMDGDAIETPLGRTDLDTDAGRFLAQQSPLIRFHYAPHGREHSAENEVPFVQATLPGAKLVVAILGDHENATLDATVTALGALAKTRKVLLVASSDMLHDPDYERVTRTDQATLEKVKALDHAAVLKSWSYDCQTLCGIGPVLVAMRFAQAQGCTAGTVLHYRNCGDDFPESRGQWVVGYGAVVFAKAP